MKFKTKRVFEPLLGRALSVSITGLALAYFSVNTVNGADHIVITRSEKSVEQVVAEQLQSTEFARQIAIYNGIATIDTVLPPGSTLQIPRPYMASIDYGRIVFVKGDVTLTKMDLVVNPPVKKAKIHKGDIVHTGTDGFVSISFNSGASINLQPQSRVLINNIDCVNTAESCVIALSATEGRIQSEVTPRPKGAPPVKFTVDTPFLSAAVRGTAFYVDVEQAIGRIGVTRGLVASDSAGTKFDLPRGKGMSAGVGIPASVVSLLPPPQLFADSHQLLVSAEDTFNWQPLKGAAGYVAKVATDAKMSRPVVVEQFETASYQPDLQPGEYYLTVAGVDQQEFVGLAAEREFSFAEIADAAPVLDIEQHGNSVKIMVQGYRGPMQFRISNSMDTGGFQIRTIADPSDVVSLDLAQDQDWVLQARKILGPLAVSAYSDYYVLEAQE